MARRGEQLRGHILWAAKDVFLEVGFERASMDEVARRAQTSKRSLYAHFESKERLFLAVIELMRELFLNRLKLPGDYAEEPAEALTLFLGRYLKVLTYEASVQMCRVSLAETERFPEQAAQYHDLWFTQVQERLSAYLQSALGASAQTSVDGARALIGRALYPRFVRTLFGLGPLARHLDDTPPPETDLNEIRSVVTDLLHSLGR